MTLQPQKIRDVQLLKKLKDSICSCGKYLKVFTGETVLLKVNGTTFKILEEIKGAISVYIYCCQVRSPNAH